MVNLNLDHFRKALGDEPEALRELGPMSLRRYLVGDFPQAIRWMLKYPRLLRALARDAEAISKEEFEEMEREADERSQKAQEARKKREGQR